MTVETAILFPLAGLATLALTAAGVALMVHFKYPRQRGHAPSDLFSLSLWAEDDPERELPTGSTSAEHKAREFVQIRRVNS